MPALASVADVAFRQPGILVDQARKVGQMMRASLDGRSLAVSVGQHDNNLRKNWFALYTVASLFSDSSYLAGLFVHAASTDSNFLPGAWFDQVCLVPGALVEHLQKTSPCHVSYCVDGL